MRLPFLVAALAISAPAASGGPGDAAPLFRPAPSPGPTQSEIGDALEARQKACRRPTEYRADDRLEWRGDKLGPRKLTELPPATGYMAVYRTINGCEEPMTVVEYRTSAGR